VVRHRIEVRLSHVVSDCVEPRRSRKKSRSFLVSSGSSQTRDLDGKINLYDVASRFDIAQGKSKTELGGMWVCSVYRKGRRDQGTDKELVSMHNGDCGKRVILGERTKNAA